MTSLTAPYSVSHSQQGVMRVGFGNNGAMTISPDLSVFKPVPQTQSQEVDLTPYQRLCMDIKDIYLVENEKEALTKDDIDRIYGISDAIIKNLDNHNLNHDSENQISIREYLSYVKKAHKEILHLDGRTLTAVLEQDDMTLAMISEQNSQTQELEIPPLDQQHDILTDTALINVPQPVKKDIMFELGQKFGLMVLGMRSLASGLKPNFPDRKTLLSKFKVTLPKLPSIGRDKGPVFGVIDTMYQTQIEGIKNNVITSDTYKNEKIKEVLSNKKTVSKGLKNLEEKMGVSYFYMANDLEKYGDKLKTLYRLENEKGYTNNDRSFEDVLGTIAQDRLAEQFAISLPNAEESEIRSLVKGMRQRFGAEQMNEWAFESKKSALEILADAGAANNGFLKSIEKENGRLRGGNAKWVKMMAMAKYPAMNSGKVTLESFKNQMYRDVPTQDRIHHLEITLYHDVSTIKALRTEKTKDGFDVKAFKADPIGYEIQPLEYKAHTVPVDVKRDGLAGKLNEHLEKPKPLAPALKAFKRKHGHKSNTTVPA